VEVEVEVEVGAEAVVRHHHRHHHRRHFTHTLAIHVTLQTDGFLQARTDLPAIFIPEQYQPIIIIPFLQFLAEFN
jgi:hypothetical protein